jgi:ABC-type uncharacterized transport system permease subunit
MSALLIPLNLYLAAAVLYHLHLFTGSAPTRRAAVAATFVGLLAHSMVLTEAAWTGQRTPFGSPSDSLSFLAWSLAVAQLVIEARSGWGAMGSLSMPIAFLALFCATLFGGRGAFSPAILGSHLMEPHVAATLLGFVGFALAFCCSLLYLLQSQLLKRKRLGGLFRRLPPLEAIRVSAHWLAAAGFSMLSLGLLTGTIWAVRAWESGWYLDPKVVTSFFAWAVYAAYLYASGVIGWRGRRTTYFLIGGFIAVLVAYYGVTMVAPTRHTF